MSKSKSISSAKKNDLILSDIEQNTLLSNLIDGNLLSEEVLRLKIKLKTLYDYLDLNPKFKDQFNKAQEIGMKTLVELMLEAFNQDHKEIDGQKLLFLREKANYLKWLAPRVSSFFQERKSLDIKSEGTLIVKWEDDSDSQDIIDITNEVETISTPLAAKKID